MAFLPLEILLLILSFIDFETLLPCVLSPVFPLFGGFDCFVDFSQMSGLRSTVVFGPLEIRKKLIKLFRNLILRCDFLDKELYSDVEFMLNTDCFKLVFSERSCFFSPALFKQPGYCYLRIFKPDVEDFAFSVLGSYPKVSNIKWFKAHFEIIRSHSKRCRELRCHKLFVGSWCSMSISNSVIHLGPWNKGEKLIFGNCFLSLPEIEDSMVVGAPVRVSLTDCGDEERVEDEVLSLLGGSENEVMESRQKALNWGRRDHHSFERSCELRFSCLEKSMEKILKVLENKGDQTVEQTVVPEDSASRVGERKRMIGDSVLPVVSEVRSTEFSLTHPGWNPIQYETDLELATSCSGVVNGEVIGFPDPGAGGLVPLITTDSRLNFLMRLHTALFKLLSENSDYPGKDFLRKFKDLREENLKFDHPSLDLLEIVLEDTVDWKRYVVKRNLFKIPGFHPGLKLTERVIGNSLISLKEEYRARWNSLVGDCVLPGMLNEGVSRWSDDRRKISGEREKERSHAVRTRQRVSDERSSHRSKTGWSILSDYG